MSPVEQTVLQMSLTDQIKDLTDIKDVYQHVHLKHE